MIAIGKSHQLRVTKHEEFGAYLDADGEEILLPKQYLPEDEDAWAVGKSLDVFVYLDSEDRPVATTETPKATVGECAHLTVMSKSDFGSFLDWGLSKDLLAPFGEQRVPMEAGKSYVVYIFIDNSGRIAASSKLDRHLEEHNDGAFEKRQEVDLLIASRSDLGFKAVIDGSHLGLIHMSDIVRPLKIGDQFTGYIGKLRKDDRINITLQKRSHEMRDELAERIMIHIIENGGKTHLTDKSSPAEINATFHVSKSNYKKALGKLFKEERITFHEKSVRLKK